jgi:UDP-N-acetylglucosamine 2-epimerase (non-hydrolysing)
MHRAENVDVETRLRALLQSFDAVQREYKVPIVCSTHPRTRAVMERFRIDAATAHDQIRFHEPFGFFDFIALERSALCVLSDSGTVQEECCLFKVANVTIRDATERPETIECGSNILSGVEPSAVTRCVRAALGQKGEWVVPPEYMTAHVSRTVVNILLGYSPYLNLDKQ